MSDTSGMTGRRRYQADWGNLRLMVEQYPEHWQVFVYDVPSCEVVHTAERAGIDAAKFAACKFAALNTFGPTHDFRPETLAAMLTWEPH